MLYGSFTRQDLLLIILYDHRLFEQNLRSMMLSSKRSGGRTPFKDLTNTNLNGAAQGLTTSNSQPPPIDPNECRRQQDREGHAQMSPQKKAKLLEKQRESHQRKKATSTFVIQESHQLVTSQSIATTVNQDGEMESGESRIPKIQIMQTLKGYFANLNQPPYRMQMLSFLIILTHHISFCLLLEEGITCKKISIKMKTQIGYIEITCTRGKKKPI